jgi:AbrB family looped-hinge helix DNA binding protein
LGLHGAHYFIEHSGVGATALKENLEPICQILIFMTYFMLLSFVAKYVILFKRGIMASVVIKPRFTVGKINQNGRIVIPVAIRKEMGIKPGESVLMEVEDGVLRMESHRARIRRVQESLRRLIPPERCLSDELIADRREEARRELEEGLG